MKRFLRWPTGICIVLLALFMAIRAPAAAETATPRVLILPLVIHSEKDLTFLNDGIMDMLAARIGQVATVIRLPDPPPDRKPLRLAGDADADFVVSGSLTVFGDSASIDALLTRVDTGETPLAFNQFSERQGEILMHLNRFADQAVRAVADNTRATDAAAPEAAAAAAAPAALPESQPPRTVGEPPAVGPTAAAADATAAAPAPRTGGRCWTSAPLKGTISALATGDVDGDGAAEMIFVHEDEIVAATRIDGRLKRLAVTAAGREHTILALDAGDVNGNGRVEIYITRLDAHRRLDSVVMEYDGRSLKSICDNQPWYFRVIGDIQRRPELLGQRQGRPSAIDTGGLYAAPCFSPGIFTLQWRGDRFHAAGRLPLPGSQSLFGVARGDIFNDGTIRTVAYTAGGTLRIYGSDGAPQWAGEETLGGNPIFLEAPSSTDVRTSDRIYLAQRLTAGDIDGDGRVEVVTVHNRDLARRFVERFRKYTHGQMVALRWNRIAMQAIWTGEAAGGYISDFSLADVDGDAQPEAVYAMVSSSGLLQTTRSVIAVERIDARPRQ